MRITKNSSGFHAAMLTFLDTSLDRANHLPHGAADRPVQTSPASVGHHHSQRTEIGSDMAVTLSGGGPAAAFLQSDDRMADRMSKPIQILSETLLNVTVAT